MVSRIRLGKILLGIWFASCHTLAGQTPVDSTGIVVVGGLKQFISVKGKDNTKPLLLFLHGGPGNSVMHYAEKFTHALQEHFIVVQWDQREAGKTKSLNPSTGSLTIDQFEQDTRQLIGILLDRFKQPKLYLAGHSWGTFLGFYIAKSYPELLEAYIAICPMINQSESERIILERMKNEAVKNRNAVARSELATVKIPFENGEQLYYHRKWVLDFMGSKAKITKAHVEEWAHTWLDVFNEASTENLLLNAPVLHCPVYFFVGRKDYQTNSLITEKYYQILQAPKKGLFWFEHSGHSLPSTEPDRLQEIIIKQVLAQ